MASQLGGPVGGDGALTGTEGWRLYWAEEAGTALLAHVGGPWAELPCVTPPHTQSAPLSAG